MPTCTSVGGTLPSAGAPECQPFRLSIGFTSVLELINRVFVRGAAEGRRLLPHTGHDTQDDRRSRYRTGSLLSRPGFARTSVTASPDALMSHS